MPLSEELRIFYLSLSLGVAIGLFYDFARSLPYCGKNITDAVFWIGNIALILFYQLVVFSGRIFWCTFFGAAISLLLYFLTVSKWAISFFSLILKKILAFFMFIFKILLTPLSFLVKILYVYVKMVLTKYLKSEEGKKYEKT